MYYVYFLIIIINLGRNIPLFYRLLLTWVEIYHFFIEMYYVYFLIIIINLGRNIPLFYRLRNNNTRNKRKTLSGLLPACR